MAKYAILSADGHFLPIAYHLQAAGEEVYIGMVRDWKEVKMVRNEKPEDKERRLSLYAHMFENRMDAAALVAKLEREKPNEWFVLAEFNYFWPYCDRLRKKGFRGLLPSKDDQRLEKDRAYAKQFVSENCPEVEVAEYQDFKSINDGLRYIDKHSDTLYVLKANSDEAPTIVPVSDDPKINRMLIEDSLERFKKWYELHGFSLEEKIPDIIEFTPEAYGWDGELIGVNCNLEHKILGSRDGNIEGCSLSLVLWQELESPMYEYFLAPLAQQMLRPNEFTIWDMSVYWSPSREKFFFGEFCPNRAGFDAVFCEIASTGGVQEWVERITSNQNFGNDAPFGTSVRVFNKQKGDDNRAWKELIICDPADPNVFLWDIKLEEGKIYTAGYDSNTMVIAGSGDTIDKAISDVYKNKERVVFDSGLSLQERDWHDTEWPQNILKRYGIIKNLEI